MFWKRKVEEAPPIIIPEEEEKEESIVKLKQNEKVETIISLPDIGTKIFTRKESSILPLIAVLLLIDTLMFALIALRYMGMI